MKIHAESKTTEKEKTSEMLIDIEIAADEVDKFATGIIGGLMQQVLEGKAFGAGCFSPDGMQDRINNLRRPNAETVRKETENENKDLK